MDPLSIIAITISIGQAVDRITTLTAKAKRYRDAPEDISTLIAEIADLKLVLDKLQSTTANFPVQDLPTLKRLLDSCGANVLQIETLIREAFVKPGSPEDTSKPKVHRFAWVQKKHEIERLREQLRDSRALLGLQLIGINASFQSQIIIAVPQLAQLTSNVNSCQSEIREGVEKILERLELTIPEILPKSKSTSKIFSSPQLERRQQLLLQDRSREASEATTSTRSNSFPRHAKHFQVCPEICECRCHSRAFLERSYWHSSLGSLYITKVGRPFDMQAPSCDKPSCKGRSTPLISVVYYFPQWLAARTLNLVFLNGSCLSFTLSFPRIVPPDAEIAICIRDGHCERIKELLLNRNASPADIIAPYGITALSLAINYGRMEVCKLLIETGGHQYAPNSQGRVADARTFWRFNVDECALHPSRLIMDRISSLGSADRHLEAVSHSILGPLQEDMPFSRLHKLVLGITTESLENVLRESRAYINDADLLGRAALHWAACQGDSSLVKKLLCCGADPDIRDRDGKTPLHMAAGLGHSEAAASLIAAGANVEVQDLFGATPMHHAAMQGQTAIIDMLLDVGADVNSLNAFSENPLMMAALANEAQSADLLCRQGANIEHRCDWRFTPLLKALKVSAYDVLQILIRREARTDVITSSGKTLIHLAAAYADAETLQLLASTNISTVDVEARDEKRCTALDYLKMRSDTDVVLQDFRKLMWCAAREGASEEDSLSDLTNDEELESEEFFDAVTFLTEGPGQENP